MLFDVLGRICSLLSPELGPGTRVYGNLNSHGNPCRSQYLYDKIASAVTADSSRNLQLSQRNDGPESAAIARDRSLQSTKGKYSRIGASDTRTTKVPIRINQFPIELTRINGF